VKRRKLGAYLLLTLAATKFAADAVLWAAIIAFLIMFGLQFPHSASMDSLWLVEKLHLWGDPILGQAASKLGWNWSTKEFGFLPIGAGFVVLAVKMVFDTVMLKLKFFVERWRPLPDETLALSAAASSKGISVSSTLLALAAVNAKAMEKIQRRYARVGHRLEMTKHRWCVFLSIGVVDAIEMKQGADPEAVSRSFKAYEAMLEEDFRLTGAWKEAWTPEGVMVCYQDVGHALDAAQRVLKGLESFNTNLNELSQPFRVCCGMNEGEVAIFEDSKLQKVSDRVIDVAGHMQKHARPNTLWLSSEVSDRLDQKSGFHPALEQVDGFSVYEWCVSPQSQRPAA
jgi:class 3 adenylate cyclase